MNISLNTDTITNSDNLSLDHEKWVLKFERVPLFSGKDFSMR